MLGQKPELQIHPAEFWTGVEAIEKLYKRKVCIAGARGDCEGGIIEAHTIPRSQLRKIATDGHVYAFCGTARDLYQNEGRYIVEKRGISQFSVLNFFCAEHDREIFSHIENDELLFDSHQLELLHYRAMGAELYKKMNVLEGVRHQIDQERHRAGDRFDYLRAFEAGQMLGLRDMARTFLKCEAMLASAGHNRVCALIVRFKKMPSIMTVGGFSPEFDYSGNLLQRLGQIGSVYEQVGLSILAAQDRAAVVLTWLGEAEVCKKFAQSFIAQKCEFLSTLAIQTAFEHLENTCMNIPWWDSLRQIERNRLVERMQFAGSPFDERNGSCLAYCGITFDQWDYESHEMAGRE